MILWYKVNGMEKDGFNEEFINTTRRNRWNMLFGLLRLRQLTKLLLQT